MNIPENELITINHFNAVLPKRGWLRVTEYSPALEQVLSVHDDVEMNCDLIDAVAANSPDVVIPKRKTLVRLLWSNY